MWAVTIVDGKLEWREHADPEPGPLDLLVQVRAAGLCRGDVMQRDGLYPPPPGTAPPELPGIELAGEVVAAGAQCRRFRPGDRVMAVVAGPGRPSWPSCPSRWPSPCPTT